MRIAFAIVVVIASALAAPSPSAAATFTHAVPAYFVPGKRVNLNAGILDPKGVQVARVYFKSDAQADYLFVPMLWTSGGRYSAVLPAPNASANAIEYLLLALDRDGQVTRTQTYKILARRSSETPAWQAGTGNGELKVFTELPDAPRTVAGFTDSISLDLVESGARFGAAAGIYPAVAGGGGPGAGSATASTSTSTPATTTAAATASAGGISTAVIIGGVVLAGAAAAGLAAAASSGALGGSSNYACSLAACARDTATGACACSGSFNTSCPSSIAQWSGGACANAASQPLTSCPSNSVCVMTFRFGAFQSSTCASFSC